MLRVIIATQISFGQLPFLPVVDTRKANVTQTVRPSWKKKGVVAGPVFMMSHPMWLVIHHGQFLLFCLALNQGVEWNSHLTALAVPTNVLIAIFEPKKKSLFVEKQGNLLVEWGGKCFKSQVFQR